PKKAPKPTKTATPKAVQTAPTKAAAAPAKAGGGEQGGAGNDVANVLTAGIDFPFPGYLTNIVRQIQLQFEVPKGATNFVTELSFLVHRDGTVTGIRYITRSGSYVFDQSCFAAVEAAGRSGKFG